jgi:hypothetical protein
MLGKIGDVADVAASGSSPSHILSPMLLVGSAFPYVLHDWRGLWQASSSVLLAPAFHLFTCFDYECRSLTPRMGDVLFYVV